MKSIGGVPSDRSRLWCSSRAEKRLCFDGAGVATGQTGRRYEARRILSPRKNRPAIIE
jgi:hypothetical protein